MTISFRTPQVWQKSAVLYAEAHNISGLSGAKICIWRKAVKLSSPPNTFKKIIPIFNYLISILFKFRK